MIEGLSASKWFRVGFGEVVKSFFYLKMMISGMIWKTQKLEILYFLIDLFQ